MTDAQIRITVGTFSGEHDDITISFSDGEKIWMAVIPPRQSKYLLKQLTWLSKRDNNKLAMIPMKSRDEALTYEDARNHYQTDWWWMVDDGGDAVSERYHCPCGASEGQFHEFGCDFESCPKCGERLWMECDCFTSLFPDVPIEEMVELKEAITAIGRVPNIVYPNHCVRCGELWPYMFMVPDAEWRYYIPPGHIDDMVCEQCYDEIVALIDKHHPKPVFELTEWEKVHRPGRVIIG